MSINVNELRVNNWYYYDKEKWQYLEDSMTTVWYNIDRIEPIPLTAEILANCKPDFAKRGFKNYAIMYNMDLQLTFFIIGLNRIVVEYVHQLQNITFALTNEELIINL